ncbi:MAG: OpgC domain-containing protein [Variibacter sp.]|nr:OpgC domain-containing protein [Variibacter sp.]
MLQVKDFREPRALARPLPDAGGLAQRETPARKSTVRDYRLDVARGLALWFIFLDHIPNNFANWFTVANYGFSDAAEIFVFVAGYSAVLAYRKVMELQGWLFAAARILKRVWQLYAAHIVLFVLMAAQVFFVSERADDPEIVTGMGLDPLGDEPGDALLAAALLRYQPTNLDILPIYMLFLLGFALVLPLLRRQPWIVLGGSVLLYVATRQFGWNLAAFPEGKHWYFDPFAWQLVFTLGATFATVGNMGERLRPAGRVLFPAALAYLGFALLIALTLQFESWQAYVPTWLSSLLYPMTKTTADPLRVLHLLALVYVVQRLVRPDAAFLTWRVFDPLRVCGKHSLKVFTAGIFLAFTARSLGEYTEDSNLAELAVSIAGIALMCALAYGTEWYRNRERGAVRRTSSPPSAPGLEFEGLPGRR